MAATAATAPADRARSLRRRVISAVVLIPLVLAAVYAGSRYFDGVVALFAIVMAWEWVRVCHGGRFAATGLVTMAAVFAAILCQLLISFPAALLALALGALLSALAGGSARGPWHGLGVLYVGLPSLAVLWIRSDPGSGVATLLWMLVLVWSVDTGAFFVGRAIGGPRLAPSISPSKTWAGLGGGMLAAALVGAVGAQVLGLGTWWPLMTIAAALALVEQGGDLVESAFKRRFGVKDSSNLIPGHGGVLDRVDGLIAVAVAVAGLMIITKGGVATWQ